MRSRPYGEGILKFFSKLSHSSQKELEIICFSGYLKFRYFEVRMEDYNFWADVLNTFRSVNDWVKALWLVVPPIFILGLIKMALTARRLSKLQELGFDTHGLYRLP